MRRYEQTLVDQMREQQHVEHIDGLDVLMKPVPDGAGRDVFDPRILERIEEKRRLHHAYAGSGCHLSFERHRPDKVTFDLTSGTIVREECLVDVDGDHMVDVFTYRPARQAAQAPLLVYLHGGGFTAGDERLFRNQMAFIAERSGATVLFPEYRLAPECPFPGAIQDCTAVIRWAHERAGELGASANRIMLAGDSAGGSLACACLLGEERVLVKQLVLIYPACDKSDYRRQRAYTWSYDAYRIVPEQRELMRSRIEKIKGGVERDPDGEKSLYLQGRARPEDPRLSIAFASDDALKAFPPTLMVTAEYDYLRIGDEYVARRMFGLGVDVTTMRYRGCDHGFLDYFGWCPQAEELCLTIAERLVGEVSSRE